MNRMVGGLLVLALAWPALADQAPSKDKKDQLSTAAQKYQALVKEYQEAFKGWNAAYQKAKTEEERKKILAEYQKADGFAPKMVELAEKNPKDPAAVDALLWAASRGLDGGKDKPKAKAMAILQRDYVKSKKIGPLCEALTNSPTPEAENFLREVMDKNPDRRIQAQACLALAEGMTRKGQAKEADKLFEFAAKKYADLGLICKGMKAPDVVGVDQDGKKFKLSDYTGKVVLLDFWGNW